MIHKPKNILITGAASGLGRSLAGLLGNLGHCLLLADQNVGAAAEVQAELQQANVKATSHVLDVTWAEQIKKFVESPDGQRVDVLVNNAGLQHVSPLEDFSEERWDLLLDVMLKGSFLLTKAVLPGMRRRGYGRIVNIGSIHSLVASPYKAAYVAAKHGLLGLSKVVALETGDADITINTICPAYIRTPLVDAQIQAQMKAHQLSEKDVIEKIFLEPMPKKAFITPEEIAGTLEFLISHEARNITGQAIVIDGGWTAH